MIGSHLATDLRSRGVKVIATSRRPDRSADQVHLDLRSGVDAWTAPAVDYAFLCAAVTSIEACERDQISTRIVNVEAPLRIARRLVEHATRVVFLSSNLVFDGLSPARRVDDPKCPMTVYGRHKAAAEEQLLALGHQVSVVRLTKVLNSHNPLLTGWAHALTTGQPIHPFDDVVLAPVTVDSVLGVLRAIVERDAAGVFHLSGDRDISYAHLAHVLAGEFGLDLGMVQPVAGRAQLVVPPARHTTLDTTALAELGVVAPTTGWSVRAVAAELRERQTVSA